MRFPMIVHPALPLTSSGTSQALSVREIAAYEFEASDAEDALATLKKFRELWEAFVPKVRAIVQASAGKPWPSEEPRVVEADRDRRALKAQLGNLAVINDPLAHLLRTTFLQPQDGLYTIFGKRSGSTWTTEVDPQRFEWVIAESEGILTEGESKVTAQRDRARRQAALLQRQLDDARAHELARLEVEHVSFKGLWKRLTTTRFGKVATWTVITLLSGILTAYGVPAIVKIVTTIWGLIRTRFGS